MANQEINAYKRLQIPVKKETLFERLKKTNTHELMEYVIAFLLNRIYIFGAMSPFGIAYFAASFPTQKRVFGIIFSCLGIVSGGFGISSLKYIGSIVIISAFSLLLRKELANKKLIYALIASLSVVANGFIYVIFNGFLLYDTLLLIVEGIVTFLSFFAYDKSVELFRSFKNRKVFENEETISIVMLCSTVILAISGFPYLAGAAHVLSVALILMLSLSCGFAVSSAAGVVLGLINSFGDVLPAQVIGVYALCGLTAGLFRKWGKWGVSISFLLTNAAVMLYLNSSMNSIITYYYIAIATVILFLIPDSFLSLFGQVVKTPSIIARENPIERAKEILTTKLERASSSFDELSEIFKELIEDRINTDVKDVSVLFDRTSDRVCRQCSMCKYCWQNGYNDTYSMLMNTFDIMQQRGYAVDIDFPTQFREECINIGEFIDTLNKNYEVYKVNLMWSGKVLESRNLVAEQFKNVSSILHNIKGQLNNNIDFDITLEKKIMTALDKKGITVTNVSVINSEGYEVTMEKNSCGSNLECSTAIAAVVSEVLGVPMLRSGRKCSEHVCSLKFREQTRFSADIGFAKIAKDRQAKSGDNHTFMLLDDGKYILALSDGMGSGSRANIQSSITIELIKRLLSAGFDKETAIRLINSVLMVNTDKETFATVDMCLINLYSGALEFIKIGAATSYLKSSATVEEIKCSSLPAGVITHIEADCELKYSKNGDFIVMVTDGVTDVSDKPENSFIQKLISDYNGSSAQLLADTILKETIKLANNTIGDDMTVLVAKIIEEM